ncbi:hypothetical protein STXM2123_3592 [Streptomyces sp. F-3]|nr:hypothetical protein STXM2123_3592 [Streptomyces sp. F-3]
MRPAARAGVMRPAERAGTAHGEPGRRARPRAAHGKSGDTPENRVSRPTLVPRAHVPPGNSITPAVAPHPA